MTEAACCVHERRESREQAHARRKHSVTIFLLSSDSTPFMRNFGGGVCHRFLFSFTERDLRRLSDEAPEEIVLFLSIQFECDESLV